MEAKGRVVGGGEVRRLHIIYFLSRTGRIEQPHLIRVTHLNKNGVYLRDVKRWLSDLRGKDMPDSFSWSYKRTYNNGYVWQDLVDDDLITPISDNEFVLKGSEIVPTSLDYDYEKGSEPKTETQTLMEASPQGNEESALFGSERSSVTDDSMKDDDGEEEKVPNDHDDDYSKESNKKFDISSSLYSILLKKSNNNHDEDGLDHDHVGKNISTPSSTLSSTSSPTLTRSPFTSKSRSHSNVGVKSSLFRNLITCGAADTKDSVMVMRKKDQYCSNDQPNGQICKGEKLGGSGRVLGTCRNQRPHSHQQNPSRRHDGGGVNGAQKQSQSHANGQKKPVCAAYKPVHGPTCSQCGKPFKPEKLHKHMKSCRGLKAMGRNAVQKKVPTNKSANNEPAAYSYLLTN